jgi:hypothetical protein
MGTSELHPHFVVVLSSNGVNPFKLSCSIWSTWLVLLLNYKIPLWVTTKKKFILFSLLISGKESVTSKVFDVYLQPLVEELQSLRCGVPCYDVLKPMGLRNFILRGILLWTIHDFLGYGTMARVAHQGYATCPICGPYFKGENFVELGKHAYIQIKKWLTKRHPYKLAGMKDHFDGQIETCNKPKNVTSKEQLA